MPVGLPRVRPSTDRGEGREARDTCIGRQHAHQRPKGARRHTWCQFLGELAVVTITPSAAQQHGGSVTGDTVPSIVQDVAKGKGLLGLYPRILDQIRAHKLRGRTS